MEGMKPETEREFLREMISLAYRQKNHAATAEERDHYFEVEMRWRDKLEAFERRMSDAA